MVILTVTYRNYLKISAPIFYICRFVLLELYKHSVVNVRSVFYGEEVTLQTGPARVENVSEVLRKRRLVS